MTSQLLLVVAFSFSPRWRFPFNERKVAAAASHLLNLHGGRMPYMRLIKLLYLADRESLRRYGRPISGDRYVAMERGPVLSTVLNLLRETPEDPARPWASQIATQGKDAVLKAAPNVQPLSATELEMLNRASNTFYEYDQWDLSEATHKLCPEWTDPGKSSKEIPLVKILKVLGKTDDEIARVKSVAAEEARIEALFGPQ